MTTPPSPPRKPFTDRVSTAIWFLLLVFAVGLGVGAILAKVRPPAFKPPPSDSYPATTVADGPPLDVGDRIEVVTSDLQSPGSDVTHVLPVDEKGEVKIPLLGFLAARGHTAAQVEFAINRGYADRNFGDRVRVKVKRVPPPAATAPAK